MLVLRRHQRAWREHRQHPVGYAEGPHLGFANGGPPEVYWSLGSIFWQWKEGRPPAEMWRREPGHGRDAVGPPRDASINSRSVSVSRVTNGVQYFSWADIDAKPLPFVLPDFWPEYSFLVVAPVVSGEPGTPRRLAELGRDARAKTVVVSKEGGSCEVLAAVEPDGSAGGRCRMRLMRYVYDGRTGEVEKLGESRYWSRGALEGLVATGDAEGNTYVAHPVSDRSREWIKVTCYRGARELWTQQLSVLKSLDRVRLLARTTNCKLISEMEGGRIVTLWNSDAWPWQVAGAVFDLKSRTVRQWRLPLPTDTMSGWVYATVLEGNRILVVSVGRDHVTEGIIDIGPVDDGS